MGHQRTHLDSQEDTSSLQHTASRRWMLPTIIGVASGVAGIVVGATLSGLGSVGSNQCTEAVDVADDLIEHYSDLFRTTLDLADSVDARNYDAQGIHSAQIDYLLGQIDTLGPEYTELRNTC